MGSFVREWIAGRNVPAEHDQGHTVVVIEHNLDVIKSADHIIDLGPEGGEAGGQIVAEGTPEEVAAGAKSFTASYLRRLFNGHEIQ